MTAPILFKTNVEGGITLEQLAQSTGCSSLEQFLGDSVLSVLLCVRVAEENRLEGKASPTLLLFEHETREGYETYDFMHALANPPIPAPRADSSFPVSDPFAEDPGIEGLPLSEETIEELEELSGTLVISMRQILQEGINLRWMLKQAADKSLDVLIEGPAEGKCIAVPTTFVD